MPDRPRRIAGERGPAGLRRLRDPGRAFLTTDFTHHSIVIEHAETERARGFAGYPVERRSDVGPATPTSSSSTSR